MSVEAIVAAGLLWLLRGAALSFLVVTVLPILRTGAWAVRGWEFPRLQLATIGVCISVALLIVAADWGEELGPAWPIDVVVLSVAVLIAALWQLSHVLPYTRVWRPQVGPLTSVNANPETAPAFRLVTTNLDMRNTSYAEVADALTAQNADVLLLIEIHQRWAAGLSTLREVYPHRVEAIAGDGLGIALWSRLPLRDTDLRYLVSEDRASIHVDLKVGAGQWIRFVGIHPVPPGLRAGRGTNVTTAGSATPSCSNSHRGSPTTTSVLG